jgi:hypothetical protein
MDDKEKIKLLEKQIELLEKVVELKKMDSIIVAPIVIRENYSPWGYPLYPQMRISPYYGTGAPLPELPMTTCSAIQ